MLRALGVRSRSDLLPDRHHPRQRTASTTCACASSSRAPSPSAGSTTASTYPPPAESCWRPFPSTPTTTAPSTCSATSPTRCRSRSSATWWEYPPRTGHAGGNGATSSSASTGPTRQLNDAMAAAVDHARHMIAERRATEHDDLLGALVHTRDEDGDRLTESELITLVFTLIIAGYETTAHLIGNGTRALLDHPEQWEMLRSDRGLMPAAIHEMLRHGGTALLTSALRHRDARARRPGDHPRFRRHRRHRRSQPRPGRARGPLSLRHHQAPRKARRSTPGP